MISCMSFASFAFRYLDRKKNVSTIPRRLEASGVVLRPDHEMIYVVFDNTFLIGAFCNKLFDHKQNCTNSLLSWDNKTLNKLDSEFEGIAYNPTSDTYFIVQETVPSPTRPKEFNSNVYEISIDPENVSMPISMIESCSVVWTFSSSSKGFEGLEFAVHQLSGKGYLLALCESNNCGKKIIDDVNGEKINEGHIVVLEKRKATQKSMFYLKQNITSNSSLRRSLSVDACWNGSLTVIRFLYRLFRA